ncbi:MAG: T9SS type A sorting domain-containing protein [Bacteroidia bacterium]|nr:T9SS type A sorting domain-containing protein [Bacteroidia bacterium]NND09706.1 hypothetical protein [Flavobacteriaceae bacterium]NNK27171.1 hypothetical protein [Flavobacteriaceae bacterium]
MKNIILIAAFFTFSLGFSQNFTENYTASIVEDINDFESLDTDATELEMFDITSNMVSGDVQFNASDKIDYINIYNSHQEEIFSARGTIIENNKINISFLPAGTYYLEVVIGSNRGSHEIIKP